MQKVASALVALGIQKDDILIVQLPNIWELAMLYLAIAQTGALISPVPMQWRLKELDYVVRLTKAKAFITISEFRGTLHGEMGRELRKTLPGLEHCISLETVKDWAKGDGVRVDERVAEQKKVEANDSFTLCWTSGTEADPKGCPMHHYLCLP